MSILTGSHFLCRVHGWDKDLFDERFGWPDKRFLHFVKQILNCMGNSFVFFLLQFQLIAHHQVILSQKFPKKLATEFLFRLIKPFLQETAHSSRFQGHDVIGWWVPDLLNFYLTWLSKLNLWRCVRLPPTRHPLRIRAIGVSQLPANRVDSGQHVLESKLKLH